MQLTQLFIYMLNSYGKTKEQVYVKKAKLGGLGWERYDPKLWQNKNLTVTIPLIIFSCRYMLGETVDAQGFQKSANDNKFTRFFRKLRKDNEFTRIFRKLRIFPL